MTWIEVGREADVARRKKVVITHEDRPIVVIAHEGQMYAMDNICIHRERELSKGVILRNRVICPGHQWAFDLATGWESVKEQCQPTYDVKVDEGVVYVDPASRRTVVPAPTTDNHSV